MLGSSRCKRLAAFTMFGIILLLLTAFLFKKPIIKSVNTYGTYLPQIEQLSSYKKMDILPLAEKDFFIIADVDSKTYVYRFKTQENACELLSTVNFSYCAAKSFGSSLYLVNSKEVGGSSVTSVVVYSLDENGEINRKEISFPLGVKIQNSTSFLAMGDYLIYINENNPSKIRMFNYKEKSAQELAFENCEFSNIALNTSAKKLYAMTKNGKYIVFDMMNSFSSKEIFVCPDTAYKFLSDNIIVTNSNTIYTEKNDTVTKNFSIESNANCNVCALLRCKKLGKDYILSLYDNNTINCFDTETYQKKSIPDKKIVVEGKKVVGLGSFGETSILIFSGENGVRIKILGEEDLRDIEAIEEPSQDVENELYIISFLNNRIIIKKDINTVSQFKDNFEFGGYTVSSFKNYMGKEISGSEKIGTGSTVVFTKDNTSLEFKIIVLGDITGEGNLNSRDLTALYNYLLGKTELTDEVMKAVDVNRDGKVNAVDLLELEKILNGTFNKTVATSAKPTKKEESPKIQKVKKERPVPKVTFPNSTNTDPNIEECVFGREGTKCDNFFIFNNTPLSVDFDAKLNEKVDFTLEKNNLPKVLIMHTHTSEAYEGPTFRSTDNNRNIVKVGDVICENLEKSGIKTIHNKTYHDTPVFPGCYDRSAVTVQRILNENPSIKIVIDIHRDSIAGTQGRKVKPTININGRNAAQILVLSACDTDGSKNHPNWWKNLKFALKVQREIETLYPGLARALYFTYGRFNQHLTTGSTLIEIGSEVNTLDEALYTGELVSEALASLIKKL